MFGLEAETAAAAAAFACAAFALGYALGKRASGSSFGGQSDFSNDKPVPEGRGELKLVLVVRNDLKMGKGKIAAQCGHATVGIYRDLQEQQRKLLAAWDEYGQAKVVVKCNSDDEMRDIARAARARGIPTHGVIDAGRTQIASGSRTVLAVGPAAVADVDAITGHLKLL